MDGEEWRVQRGLPACATAMRRVIGSLVRAVMFVAATARAMVVHGGSQTNRALFLGCSSRHPRICLTL